MGIIPHPYPPSSFRARCRFQIRIRMVMMTPPRQRARLLFRFRIRIQIRIQMVVCRTSAQRDSPEVTYGRTCNRQSEGPNGLTLSWGAWPRRDSAVRILVFALFCPVLSCFVFSYLAVAPRPADDPPGDLRPPRPAP